MYSQYYQQAGITYYILNITYNLQKVKESKYEYPY